MKYEKQIDSMVRHYLIAALWADSPEGANPRITKQAIKSAKRDCMTFCQNVGYELLDEVILRHTDGYGQHPDCGKDFPVFAAMGHDLWLTRNGHGTGFWDREELKVDNLGEKLTKIARNLGEANCEFYRGWFYHY